MQRSLGDAWSRLILGLVCFCALRPPVAAVATDILLLLDDINDVQK